MSLLKAKDRTALREWDDMVRQMQQLTELPLKETVAQKQARIKRLLNDYEAFVRYYFASWAEVQMASFQKKGAQAVIDDKDIAAVMAWFRGSAKSMTFCTFVPLFLMARGELKFGVIIGQNQEKAELLLGDLQLQLEFNQRYIADFGKQCGYGKWAGGSLETEQGVYWVAAGMGVSPRGLRRGNARPDYVVCDDLDTEELNRNQERTREAVDWVKSLPALRGIRGIRLILTNNIIHPKSIAAQLMEMPSWYTLRVDALDKKGNPTWRELYTKEVYAKLREQMGLIAFEREYMNNPQIEGALFKGEWLIYKPIPHKQWGTYSHIVGYFDPSYKNTEHADYKAITVVGAKAGTLEYHVLAVFVRRCDIGQAVRWMFEQNDRAGAGVIIHWWMEQVLLQDMLMSYVKDEERRIGRNLRLMGDKREKPAKEGRIQNLAPLFEQGRIIINENMKGGQDYSNWQDQLLAFGGSRRSHDDAPDSLEGAIWLLERQNPRNTQQILMGRQPRRHLW